MVAWAGKLDQFFSSERRGSKSRTVVQGALFPFHLRKTACLEAESERRRGVAVYHLKASFGSRAGGQSACAKSDYIGREGKYEKDAEELEHTEHGNMPEWARSDPAKYWQAADENERANGRLYSEVQFALPQELSADGRREVAADFAEQLTGGERLPYTLAIHRGGTDGENPHAHLMFSERGHDGIERGAEQWFRRYNAKAPEQGGARKSRASKAGDWLDKARGAWERTANRALEQAGRGERIDRRSLAALRDEAYRAGDLQRAAELSREPNVHLGPERYRMLRGGASATVQQAARVKRTNAADRGERDTDSRQVERLKREIAGIEARLKETYDRVRTALDERIRQAGRAVRAGSEAAGRAGRALGRAGATVGRAIRRGAETVRRVGGFDKPTRRGPPKDGRACDEIDRRLRRSGQEIRRSDQRLQRARGGFDRTLSLIHAEAQQKRKAGERWDRVEGRIESLIQGRVRSRDRGGPEL